MSITQSLKNYSTGWHANLQHFPYIPGLTIDLFSFLNIPHIFQMAAIRMTSLHVLLHDLKIFFNRIVKIKCLQKR